MKAEELRINNLVRDPFYESYETEEFVTVDCIEVDNNWKDYEPIPLTEEWLLKCGFEKCGKNDFYENLHEIQVNGNKCFVELSEENGLVFVIGWGDYYDHHQEVGECLYVHELQNLYYALTKEELKFEL